MVFVVGIGVVYVFINLVNYSFEWRVRIGDFNLILI